MTDPQHPDIPRQRDRDFPIRVDFSELEKIPSPPHQQTHPTAPPPVSPQHTDQCLEDYRAFGFCDHTLLSVLSKTPTTTQTALARPTQPASQARRRPRPHRRLRTLLSWTGLVLCTTATVYLTRTLGCRGVLVFACLSTGWLLVAVCGLPRSVQAALETDLSKVLPPDARQRLDDPDHPRPPHSSRPSHHPRPPRPPYPS